MSPTNPLTFGQSLGLATAGPVVSGLGNIIATGMQNKANKELAEYSFDMQRQMIQEQNEYNSPVNQMARYKEAGLSPNLMFGGIDSGGQSGIAKYDAPTMQRPDIPQVDLLSSMRLMLEAKKNEAEIRNIDAQTQRYQEETQGLILKNAWESFLSGKPRDGWTFAGSKKARQYDLGLEGQDIVNTMHTVQTELSRLNVQERNFFIDKLLPLTLQLKNLEIQGASYDNMMKAVDASLWRDKRISEISNGPYRIAGLVIDNLLNPRNAGPVKRGLVKPKKWHKGPDGRIWYGDSPAFNWHW